jgi:hypothetical protein
MTNYIAQKHTLHYFKNDFGCLMLINFILNLSKCYNDAFRTLLYIYTLHIFNMNLV